MGRGSACVDEAMAGPDGALYRRGRRRLDAGSYRFPTQQLDLRYLTAVVDQLIDQLELQARTALTVCKQTRPLGGWRVEDGLGAILARRTRKEDAIEDARSRLAKARYGGRLVICPDTGKRAAETVEQIAGYSGETLPEPLLQLKLEPPRQLEQEQLAAYFDGRRVGAVSSSECEPVRRVLAAEAAAEFSCRLRGVPQLVFDSAGRVNRDRLLVKVEQVSQET